jgi:RNA polymerase subunit RPABC4/transcription elongation factor Spt4
LELFIFWFGLCVAVAILASKRGRSGFGWFLFSFFLSPLLGLIFVLILDKKNGGDSQEVSAPANTLRNCPECKELIRKDARKCKHCGSVVEPLVDSLSTYSEEASRLATKIYGGGGDISDYINLIRSLNYECVQKGVIKTTFDVKVNSQIFNFENDDTFKNWVNENLVSRIVAREEISI